MARLDGRCAWITGGASGIGAATVRRFVAEGAEVWFTDLDGDAGAALAAETGATFRAQDVSEPGGWDAIADEIAKACGRLDVLMNNAGIVGSGDVESLELDAWRRVLAVNLDGVLLGCRTAIAMMRRNPDGPSGSILNVASTSAFTALPGDAAYSTSKGGVRSLSKAVAVHCARAGTRIRSNAIVPGAIETGITKPIADASPELRAVFEHMSPFGRMGTPDDVAGLALFLASDDAAFCTGAEFLVDGGMLAGHPGI